MTNCPHCGKELNLGSLVAQNRWKKTTKKQRTEAMRKLALGNKNRATHKKLSTVA